MTKQMIIRIEESTKTALSALARNEGCSASDIVRKLIDEYIKKRDIGTYIDDLWKRTGDAFASKDYNAEDIDVIIKNVRREAYLLSVIPIKVKRKIIKFVHFKINFNICL
jgi:predicted DNA-binding protein